LNDWLRRAGSGRDQAGATVIWSVSEGSRGRRWREVRIDGSGAIVSSLLLETDPTGRFLHTELSTPAGLLTLHPEGDGTIHGNTVTRAGIGHVRGLPWRPDAILVIDGSTIAACAAAQLIGRLVGSRRPTSWQAVTIDPGLVAAAGVVAVDRVGEAGWRIGSMAAIQVTPARLPVLAESEEWPLEGE
jgi:hypothetical protein